MNRPFSWVAVAFLVLVGLIHLLRVALGVSVVVGGTEVPVWLSAPAGLFCLGLALLVAREARRA